MTESTVKRGRGRPKGSTNAVKAAEKPSGAIRPGVIARDKFGRLGLVTGGPTPLFLSGERKELWTGVQVFSEGNLQSGGGWASYDPTFVLDLEHLR